MRKYCRKLLYYKKSTWTKSAQSAFFSFSGFRTAYGTIISVLNWNILALLIRSQSMYFFTCRYPFEFDSVDIFSSGFQQNLFRICSSSSFCFSNLCEESTQRIYESKIIIGYIFFDESVLMYACVNVLLWRQNNNECVCMFWIRHSFKLHCNKLMERARER